MEENKEVRIGRYLSGEMKDLERVAFEQELAQDQALRSIVEADGIIWKATLPEVSGDWNVDAAWNRFSERTHHTGTRKQPKVRRMTVWAVAAAAILFVGIYGLFIRPGAPVVYTYQEGITEEVALKDGSKIYLNKNAELIVYPFKSSNRRVDLKGEAYFEVASDPSRPFIVNAGSTVTEVIGTSFNIRQANDQTWILVTSGKVIFSPTDHSQTAAALTSGEAAVYRHGQVELIANPSPNVDAWRTHELRFVKMPLSTVIEDISNYFDQEIEIENEASKVCPITIPIAFKKPEVNAILGKVAASIGAELVQEGQKFIIRGGKDCS